MNSKRFVVTVIAPDPTSMRRLAGYGLDLFRHSTRAIEKTEIVLNRAVGAPASATALEAYAPTDQRQETRELTIDGFLTLDAIVQLVEEGYSVLIQEPMAQQPPTSIEGMEFQDWLKGIEED
ncbi:hypothetical protein [Egbenema bharatensis]|uniref:hypothetical protein n=1 Tax=Egbenema bharatensis TaxID=3463334 RepID=UPI003A83A6A8